MCIEVALKYKTRTEWRLGNGGSYNSAYKSGWLDECCTHMIVRGRIPKWTKAECIEDASNYKTRKEWSLNGKCCTYAKHKRWMGECCEHMISVGNRFSRMIYSFGVGNEIYIGLTYNLKVRQRDHRYNGTQYRYLMEIYGEDSIEWKTLADFMPATEASIMERKLINEYRQNGYITLNKVQGGSLGGGTLKWTYDKCQTEALKYKTKVEWYNNSSGSFQKASKEGWLSTMSSHMIPSNRESGYWTKERCMEDALKYKSRTEWCRYSSSGYSSAQRAGWIDECCEHMPIPTCKPNGYWDLERCKEVASQYTSKTDWKFYCSGSYSAALRGKWLDECCSHMDYRVQKPHGYWTKERCLEDASKYQKRSEWAKLSHPAYIASHKNGWLDECCKHMTMVNNPVGYWTKERCMEDALKYKSRSDWGRGSYGCKVARTNGWIDECTNHMETFTKLPKYWTKERCMEDALKYKSRTEWRTHNLGAISAAYKKGWIDECCEHMTMIHKPRGYWTLERCKEDALKYTSKVAWKTARTGAVSQAYKKGWIDECCKHMHTDKKPDGYWTLERCKEDALKYTSKGEWNKASSAYQISSRKGWIGDCCKHMPKRKKRI